MINRTQSKHYTNLSFIQITIKCTISYFNTNSAVLNSILKEVP